MGLPLTWKSTCEEGCPSPLGAVELPDVPDDWDAGPMSVEDSCAVVVLFAEDSGGKPGSIGCDCESSDPAEEVDVCAVVIHLQSSSSSTGRKNRGQLFPLLCAQMLLPHRGILYARLDRH